ncbi:MAG: DNA-directed DNA polymerase I [Zestosphaera sp.]
MARGRRNYVNGGAKAGGSRRLTEFIKRESTEGSGSGTEVLPSSGRSGGAETSGPPLRRPSFSVSVGGVEFDVFLDSMRNSPYSSSISSLEFSDEVPESYFLGSYYSGELRKAYLKFYDDVSGRTYIWVDKTGHMPYFLTDTPPEELGQKIIKDKSFERVEVVRKHDLLRVKDVTLTKVVAKDPLAIPRMRTLVASAWEANIKYHDCYVFDNGLIPGMRYTANGRGVSMIQPKLGDDVMSLYKNVVKGEEELLELALRMAPLFEERPPRMRRLAVDIEVYTPTRLRVPDPSEAHYPIISIALAGSDGLRRVLVVYREGLNIESVDRLRNLNTEVEIFDSERGLVLEVFRTMNSYPLIITFNGDNFDLPYLHNRAVALGIDPLYIPIEDVRDFVGIRHGFHIDLYKFFSIEAIQNYAFSQAYKEKTLDAIAQALLGETKVVIEVSVSDLTMDRLVEYNMKDAELSLNLTTFNNELVWKLIVLIMRLAKMSLEDVTRHKVSAWVKNLMYWEHRRSNYLIPEREELKRLKGEVKTAAKIGGKRYAGAIVIDPVPGVYFNVVVLDFASLYPSIIKVWNLSYETIDPPSGWCEDGELINVTDEKGEILHRVCVSRKGITSALVGLLRDFRVGVYKKLAKQAKVEELKNWYDVVQKALKVYVNASYGVFGHESFPFYTPSLAESVTALGRYVITRTLSKAGELGLKVLYGDTDSLFVWSPEPKALNTLIEWVEDELSLEIEQDKTYKYVAFALKKNYIGVLEGGRVDVKGLVGKKKNVPKILQDSFIRILELISRVEGTADSLEGVKDEIRREVRELYLRLRNKDFTLDDVVFKTTLSKDVESYVKTTPIHVKAALQLKRHGVPVESGVTVLYVKVRGSSGVKPVQLAKVEDVDTAEYLRTAKSMFQQLLMPFSISWEEVAGGVGLTHFTSGNNSTLIH